MKNCVEILDIDVEESKALLTAAHQFKLVIHMTEMYLGCDKYEDCTGWKTALSLLINNPLSVQQERHIESSIDTCAEQVLANETGTSRFEELIEQKISSAMDKVACILQERISIPNTDLENNLQELQTSMEMRTSKIAKMINQLLSQQNTDGKSDIVLMELKGLVEQLSNKQESSQVHPKLDNIIEV